MVITQEEFQEWKEHLVTKALLKALHNDREYMKEMVVRGNVDNLQEVLGRCNAILSIIDLTYEDLVEGAREDAKY